MSRYRNDLSAAHERITQLEDELALSKSGTSPPPPAIAITTPSEGRVRSKAMIAAVVFATAGIVVGVYEHQHHHEDDHHVGGAHVAVPIAMPAQIERPRVTPKLQATWSGATDVVPSVADVDGDGVQDLIGVFTRRANDGTEGRHAIAIDGNTFDVKWSAGPFTGTDVRLTVAGRRVVVANEGTRLRTLALGTGRTLAEQPIDGIVTELCPADEGRVLLRRGTKAGAAPAYYGDDLVLRPAPASARCPERPVRCVDGSSRRPCVHGSNGPQAPRGAIAGFQTWRTFEDRDGFVAVGTVPNEKWRGETRALGFARGAKVPSWEGSLLFSIDHLHDGHVRHDLANGRLVSLYETDTGMWRVLAHDAWTGAELWYGAIPHATESSHVTTFAIEGPYVFVVTDGTLHVLDAASGRYLRGLDATTI